MRSKTSNNELSVHVDSAGTSSYHTGENPDPRAIETARRNGVNISDQKARKVSIYDLDEFDVILTMDRTVFDDVRSMTDDPEQLDKIHLFLAYSGIHDPIEVPDPYFGGDQGFMSVYSMIDEACERIIDRWQMMGVTS
jgi:protein-tyrosine phosphatase